MFTLVCSVFCPQTQLFNFVLLTREIECMYVMFVSVCVVLLFYIYRKHPNQPYVGLFLGGSPCLLVRDFELAHAVVNKELESFATRIVQFDKKRDPILNKT